MTGILIGVAGSALRAEVDASGRIDTGVVAARFLVGVIDTGAADQTRWVEPGGPATTPRAVDGLPVVETAVRVPGGHAVATVWASSQRGGPPSYAWEVHNESTQPIAVALVLRGRHPLEVDGLDVRAGGHVVARLGRAHARTLDREVAPDELALVWPLAHTARLRVSLAGDAPPGDPAALAGPEQVRSGWMSHLDAACRVVWPHERLAEVVRAARTRLLLDGDGEIAAVGLGATALAGWGHDLEAAERMDAVMRVQRLRGGFGSRAAEVTPQVLWGLAEWVRTGVSPADPERVAAVIAKAAHRLRRRGGEPASAVALGHAAGALALLGQPEAAAALPPVPPRVDALDVLGIPGVALDAPAFPASTADASAVLLRVRAVLVGPALPALDLFPGFPDAWLGQGVEVHRMPTAAGRLSVALRWHGPRPALLWDLDGAASPGLRAPASTRPGATTVLPARRCSPRSSHQAGCRACSAHSPPPAPRHAPPTPTVPASPEDSRRDPP